MKNKGLINCGNSSITTYIVGNHVYDMILMSNHNVLFMREYCKLSLNYHQIPSLSGAGCSKHRWPNDVVKMSTR